MSKADFDRILDEIVTLPSAPTVLIRVTELVENPSISLRQIAEAISADPPISMKVLRLVNSAYYGLRSRVGSLEQAIPLLGLKVVKNLVVTATVFHTFSSTDSKEGPLLEREQFWLHCVGTGMIAKAIVRCVQTAPPVDSEEIFVAGLLHDVGKIILQQHLHKKFQEALTKSATGNVPLHECETESIGISHAQIGGRLAEKWKLPQEIVQAIYHHHPSSDQSTFPYSAAVVNLADFICYAKEIGNGGPTDSVRFVTEAWRSTQLKNSDIPTIMSHVKDDEKLAAQLLNVAR